MPFRLLALFLLFAISPALADCPGRDLSADPSIKPDWSQFSDEFVNGEGLLWRIEKPNLQPSFLFGTLHLTDLRAIAVAKLTEPYVKGATVLAVELDVTDANAKAQAQSALVQAAQAPDRDVFDGLIEGDDVARVEAMLAQKGVVHDAAHHYDLWLLLLYALWPQCELEKIKHGDPTVDAYLVNFAKAYQVDVVELLTHAEYDRALESIPVADAASELKLIARSDDFIGNSFATYISLYEQKRLGAARAFLESPPLRASEAELRANRTILKLTTLDFNQTLADRSGPLLEKGGAFVAVAAQHLWGKLGLIERIKARGYAVSKVW